MLDNNLIMGPLRAIIPATVAYVIGKGWLPAWMPVSDVDAALVALISAYMSYRVHSAAPPVTPGA
jgi:hypothetical protein